MAAEHRVLVPEHQQLSSLCPVAAEHQDSYAEDPARQQVDDLEQHPASQPSRRLACWRSGRSALVEYSSGTRSLPGWLGTWAARTSCPRCPCASLFAGIGPASGQWQDRADRSCRAGPGLAGESLAGCERWPCRSDFQGETVSGACPAGEYGHRLRQAGAQWRARPGQEQ